MKTLIGIIYDVFDMGFCIFDREMFDFVFDI